jgi:glutamine synthetase
VDTLAEPREEHAAMAASLAEEGVQFAIAGWTDVRARLHGKVVPIGRLADLVAGSERFTPRGLDGLGETTPEEDECVAVPDIETLRRLPWDPRFVVMVADLVQEDRPFELCARSILRRQTDAARELGYRTTLGVETELYVFQGDGSDPEAPLVPLARSGSLLPSPAYDMEATLDAAGFLSRMAQYMQALDFGLFSFDHEGGNGQYEFDFQHDETLATCDKLALFRVMVRQAAKEAGGFATFMPKPTTELWGSGAHFNMGLEWSESGTTAFRETDTLGGTWSSRARSFVAGMLRHAPALAALACPTVNSYKRLVPWLPNGDVTWAPIWITYGDNNRSCMLRLPRNRPAIENRVVDAAANPYLVAAFSIAAGLEGIREGADPGPPVDARTYLWQENGQGSREHRLPRTLLEAIEAFEADPLVHDVFPEGFVRDYSKMKRGEWESYHAGVSAWERAQYLSSS